MATINLAPGTQYLTALRRRRRWLFILSTVITIVVMLVGVGLWLYSERTERAITVVQEELRGVETQIAAMGPEVDRINLFEQRLAVLDTLLQNHISWSPFFTDLERLLPAPTVLNELQVDIALQSATIVATTPTIDEVAQTLASLTSSPTRPTIFQATNLNNIKRVESAIPDAPVSVVYSFNAKLPFRAELLKTSRVAVP
ncbi:MAG: hypothetical protein WD972_02450 [Candidatus Andersenbacteria bacterium]